MKKIISILQKNSFNLSLLCFFLVSFYSYGAYSIGASSFLGGSGTTDRVYGSAILSDGTIVLAACITDAQPGNLTPVLLNGATASSSGAIIRLSSDGRTVLSVTRVADQVTDLSIDSQDRLYIAAMGGGALILNNTASTLLWSNTFSKSVQRIDASPSGRFAVLLSNTTFLNKAVTSGEVYNYNNTWNLAGNWSTGMQYSLDVCIDETSQTVISLGFKNITAADQSGYNPVDVSIYKGWSYTGSQKYKAYDWNGTRDDPKWINLPENNMADSRGARCEIGDDGKLYMAFAVDGGNHIFRYSPFNISTPSSIVGGDKYHAFYNTKTEKKTFFGRYNPNDGTYIKGQLFCARLSSGAGSTAHPEFGDIHADADGRVYVIGSSASGLPITMEPISGGYTGGAFVLVMDPDFTTRELCTRTAIGGEGHTIAVRNGKVVIGGYIPESQTLYTTSAIDATANGNDGFFSVFSDGFTVAVTATPVTGNVPLTVNFAATISGATSPSYSWNFGDGSALATLAAPSHTYTTAGTYTATLTVTDGTLTRTASSGTITVGQSQLISNVTNGPKYVRATGLKANDTYYTDRTYTISTLPSALVGAEFIKAANNDKSLTTTNVFSATFGSSARVYIAYEAQATAVPNWMTTLGFTKIANQQITTTDITFDLYSANLTGTVIFGGNKAAGAVGTGSTYFVIAVPEASAVLISNVTNGPKYVRATGLKVNDTYYTDRTYTINTLPSALVGAEFIKAANNDKSLTTANVFSATFGTSARVYIAYGAQATAVPNWMTTLGFTKIANQQITTTDITFDLYSANLTGTVIFGANKAAGAVGVGSTYFVIAVPEAGSTLKSKKIETINTEVQSTLGIYPNPAKNYVTISASSSINRIELISVSGKVMDIKQIGGNEANIQLSAYPTGIYVIIVSLENGQLLRKKLVVE